MSAEDPLPSPTVTLAEGLSQNKVAVFGLFFGLAAFFSHHYDNPYLATSLAAVSIALLSITVSDVAEVLAERLNEPYGSFVLTFSAVIVEIILLFMVLVSASDAVRALETVRGGIISAVIVDMNVLLGLAVFIGGLAFKEQEHNEDTSSTYTTILLVASSALLVPSILKYTAETKADLLLASNIIGLVLFLFYIVIFIFQTKTHSHFFKATARSRLFRYKRHIGEEEEDGEIPDFIEQLGTVSNFFVIFMLLAVIGFIAEIFAEEGMSLVYFYDFPIGLAGLIIAIISVAPEIMTAVKAARNDQIQRVINIAMGASTVSIMLTVPAMLALSYTTDHPLSLDFNTLQVGALILTIILAWKTTENGETNYFEGSSHLFFFICYAIIAAFY